MSAELLEIIEQLRAELAKRDAEVEGIRALLLDKDRQILQLGEELARARRELTAARERMEELERAQARQAAPFRRPENKKVPPSERKRPGRKPGHPGAFRAVPRQVDQEIEAPLVACPNCHGPLTDRRPQAQYIEELPPIRPLVIRLTTWSAKCACCGEVRSTHPLQTSTAQGVARTMLGPRALALASLLNKHLGNTMRRTCQILRHGFGLSITPGGLSQALDRVADKLQGDYQQLLERLRQSAAAFVDETSWWVGGPGNWLWVFTTQLDTLYHVDPGRDSGVVLRILGPDYPGMLVSDCLSTYDVPPYRKHKCIAHHLKAIRDARDGPGTGDTEYLRAWVQFFKLVTVIYKSRQNMTPESYAERCQSLEKLCDALLSRPCEKPGEVAVRNRLQKQRPHLLGCLYEPAAEPTNNLAERNLRPAVIARKLSCGNKTPHGSYTWQIIASLAQTCANRGIDFLAFVTQRLPLHPNPMPAG